MAIFWLALCAVQVFFMQAGFYFLESGSVRKQNTLNVAVKNIDFATDRLLSFGLTTVKRLQAQGLNALAIETPIQRDKLAEIVHQAETASE